MQFIDTHSHLNDSAFDQEVDQIIARSLSLGVDKILVPGVDSSTNAMLFALAHQYPENIHIMVGLHPTSVNHSPNYKQELKVVEELLANPPVSSICAVGEIGIDLHWSQEWEQEQREAFSYQIELALKYQLPINVHSRDSWPTTLDVLSKYKGQGLRGVIHAFSGGVAEYEACRKCGEFLFGIGGVVTYKNSTLPDVVKQIPLEQLVLETDAPYLPPVPYRGKRNEPSYIPIIAEKIALIKGVSIEEVAAQTTRNAESIFRV